MFLNLFCLTALVLSVFVMALSAIIAVGSHKSSKLAGDSIITPFHLFIIGFFVSAVFLFVPVTYSEFFVEDPAVIRGFKSLIFSFICTIRVFLVDCDIEIIESVVTDSARVNSTLGYAYSLFSSIVFVGAPVLTAGFVLSFFKNVSAKIRYFLLRKGEVYYISELNDRSLVLAENILNEKPGITRTVVFFSVKEKEQSESTLTEEAKKLGAICLSKNITEADLKQKNNSISRKFYFINLDEDKNVRDALELINICNKNETYNTSSTAFYVFATTADSEVMLDSADNGNMTVRRVNEYRNIVWNTLLCEPKIFSDYIDTDGLKTVNALVVGQGHCGTELIKALCWAGQLPNYRINIHVVDKDKDAESKFKALAPELVERSGIYEYGEAYYNLHFHNGIDVHTSEFSDLIRNIGEISVAFVALGDDRLDVGVAMQLRRYVGRLNLECGFNIPNIYTVVYNTLKNDVIVKNGGLKCLGETDYGIRFIGDIRERYSLEVIEQEELEEVGKRIHLSWLEHEKKIIRSKNEDEQEINDKIEKSRLAYHKYEYFRRASIASAVHIRVIKNLGISFADEQSQNIIEHNRWNAFMRSEGYVFDQNAKDHIARTHTDLKVYKNLKPEIQNKDNISANAAKS